MKNRRAFIITVIGGLMGLMAAGGHGQPVGTTSMQFLKVMPHARAVSMAGAFVTLPEGSESVFWNPAGLVNIKGMDVTLHYTDYIIDTYLTSVSAAFSLKDRGTIAIFGTYLSYGDVIETREDMLGFGADGAYNPGLTGNTLHPMAMYVGIGYAIRLIERFSFGLTARYIKEDLHRISASTWTFDPGIIYRTGYRSLKVGMTIRNFGAEVKYAREEHPLPQELDLGLSGYLFSPDDALLGKSASHSLLVAVSILHPRDYDQQFLVGMEYGFLNHLYLRGGYRFNFDNESLTLGAGLRLAGMALDYGYSDYGEYLDAVHRFSFIFNR